MSKLIIESLKNICISHPESYSKFIYQLKLISKLIIESLKNICISHPESIVSLYIS